MDIKNIQEERAAQTRRLCSLSNVPRVRLGDYIERSMVNNSKLQYGVEYIEGVNNEGTFCKTRANLDGINLKPYKLVNNGDFVYNPARFNIGSIAYRTQGFCIVSHLYVVFRLTEYGKKHFVPEFLFLYIHRPEFFRKITYLNFGSQRPEFNFFELSEILVPCPSIEVQRELVAVYEGLRRTAEQNEAMLKPLNDACHAYIVDCKEKYPSVKLGEYIEFDEEVNRYNHDYPFIGININKEFMPTSASTEGLDKRKYKIMRKGRFVFSGMQTGRDIAIRLGLYNEDNPALVSPAYTTFSIKKEVADTLCPEMIALYFSRKEMDRLGWFYSDSSVRSNLDWERFCEMQIPLPPIDVQQSIVSLYRCAEEAKSIAKEARELMRTICPALIQRAARGT